MDVDPATQLVYFLDEEAFHDTDRPGFRRRVVTGEHLQMCFWRIDGGASGSFLHHHVDNEQLGIVMRGALDFRIGGPDVEERVVLKAGRGLPGAARRVARRQRLHRRRGVRRVLDPRRLRPPS